MWPFAQLTKKCFTICMTSAGAFHSDSNAPHYGEELVHTVSRHDASWQEVRWPRELMHHNSCTYPSAKECSRHTKLAYGKRMIKKLHATTEQDAAEYLQTRSSVASRRGMIPLH